MGKTIETYIVGSKVPDWMSGFMSNGVVQRIENDDEVYYRINSPVGIKIAHNGDVLVRTKSGVSLVPADKAEKFKMVRKPQKVEANKDEE